MAALGDHLFSFRQSVDALNAFVAPFVLRRYQAELLNTGGFDVISPLSGERVRVTRSTMLGRRIAYLIPPNSWLVTGPLRHSLPLDEAVSATDECSVPLLDVRGGTSLGEKEIEFLRRSAAAMPNRSPAYGVTLLIGNSNFAHHIWNELPGLEQWLRDARPERISAISVIAREQPLGELKNIFPELAEATFLNTAAGTVGRYLDKSAIVVCVGSQLVTDRIRRRIRDLAARHNGDLPHMPASAWPKVWISVRLGSRTADNFEHFLIVLLRKLFVQYPNANILLDGFSYPVGFFTDERMAPLHDSFRARSTAIKAFVAGFRDKVSALLGVGIAGKLFDLTGLDLYAAIRLAGCSDFYICHAGTLQHKIGWFCDVPGLIHLPSPHISRAEWHAAQVEGGILPDFIPASLVEVTDPPTAKNNIPRNFNYRFIDVERAAQYVLDSMERKLKPPDTARVS